MLTTFVYVGNIHGDASDVNFFDGDVFLKSVDIESIALKTAILDHIYEYQIFLDF